MKASASALPHSIRAIRPPSRGGAARRAEAQTKGAWIVIASSAALGAALAFLLVHASALMVIGVALLPIGVWLLTRSYGGLALGLILILVLPYWHTLGSSHVTILRVASVSAALTVLVNRRFRFNRVDFALLLLVLVLVLDWILRYRQPGASSALVVELTPIGFYLGARALPPERVRLVALILVIAGAVGGLTVIYEFLRGYVLFHNPSSYDWNSTNNTIFRPAGVFGSPPAASTVMCFVVLFGLACTAIHRGKLMLISAGCTAIASLALILTFTRAALIGGGVAIIILLWLIRSPLLRPLRVAWFAVLIAGLYFLLIPGLQNNATFQRGILRPGTLSARESYWSVALPLATSSWHTFILGTGTGTLEAPRTANAVVASQIAESPQLTENSLHSQYVTTLVEQGAIGVAALIFVLVAGAIPPARAARAARDPIMAAAAASIVAIAAVMLVDTAFLVPPALAMLMLALGLGGSAVGGRSSAVAFETAA